MLRENITVHIDIAARNTTFEWYTYIQYIAFRIDSQLNENI